MNNKVSQINGFIPHCVFSHFHFSNYKLYQIPGKLHQFQNSWKQVSFTVFWSTWTRSTAWSNFRLFLQEDISRLSWIKSRGSCHYSCWDALIILGCFHHLKSAKICYFCLKKYGATLISSLEQHLPSKSWNELTFFSVSDLQVSKYTAWIRSVST